MQVMMFRVHHLSNIFTVSFTSRNFQTVSTNFVSHQWKQYIGGSFNVEKEKIAEITYVLKVSVGFLRRLNRTKQ